MYSVVPVYREVYELQTSGVPQLDLVFNKLYLKQAGVDEGVIPHSFQSSRCSFACLYFQVSLLQISLSRYPNDLLLWRHDVVLRTSVRAVNAIASVSLPAVGDYRSVSIVPAQSNLSNMDTEGTEQSAGIREVSVL